MPEWQISSSSPTPGNVELEVKRIVQLLRRLRSRCNWYKVQRQETPQRTQNPNLHPDTQKNHLSSAANLALFKPHGSNTSLRTGNHQSSWQSCISVASTYSIYSQSIIPAIFPSRTMIFLAARSPWVSTNSSRPCCPRIQGNNRFHNALPIDDFTRARHQPSNSPSDSKGPIKLKRSQS